MIQRDSKGAWPSIVRDNNIVRQAEYREPEWPLVKCRALRRFQFRNELRKHGMIVPLEPMRVLAIGETFECIEPFAREMVALGRVELLK